MSGRAVETEMERKHMDAALEAYRLTSDARNGRPLEFERLKATLDRLDSAGAAALIRRLLKLGTEADKRLLFGLLGLERRVEVKLAILMEMERLGPVESYLSALAGELRRTLSCRICSRIVKMLGPFAGVKVPLKLLTPYLRHDDARVRANTLEGMLESPIASELEGIFKLMCEDPAPRVRALAALGCWRCGDERLLAMCSCSSDRDERLACLYVLRRTSRDPRILDVLEDAMNAVDDAEALCAAGSYLELLGEAAVEKLLDAALMRSAGFRDRVAAMLARRAPSVFHRTLCERMMRKLETPAVPDYELSGMLSMAAEAGEGLPCALLRRLMEHPDERVVADAMECMNEGMLESSSLKDLVMRQLRGGARRPSVNAAVLLWRAGCVEAMSFLRAMLSSPEQRDRNGALFGLGRIGGVLADAIAAELRTA